MDWTKLWNGTRKQSPIDRALDLLAERDRKRDAAEESLRRQNKTALEALIADSVAKTALLDRIVASKFDRPVVSNAGQPQTESPTQGLMGFALADALSVEDDGEFLEKLSEVTQ